MTEELQLVNGLMEASEALRRIFPDTYDEKSRQVQAFIRQVMEAQQKDVLPVALLLMEDAQEKGREADIHWFAAAAQRHASRPGSDGRAAGLPTGDRRI